METTARAFLDHWAWAAEKGVMNRNTAAGLRAACSQVLTVLDDWENVDVKGLDVEATLHRFQNLKKKAFKPSVLETYKRRFRRAHASYLGYLSDPGGWKPRGIERPRQDSEAVGSDRESRPAAKHEMHPAGTVEYPFPLRSGQIARLILPRDLKASEAKRLAAFIATLAVDFDASSGSPE